MRNSTNVYHKRQLSVASRDGWTNNNGIQTSFNSIDFRQSAIRSPIASWQLHVDIDNQLPTINCPETHSAIYRI